MRNIQVKCDIMSIVEVQGDLVSKVHVRGAYFFSSGMALHSCRIGVGIPFWLEWNGVIPFLRELSGHSIPG